MSEAMLFLKVEEMSHIVAQMRLKNLGRELDGTFDDSDRREDV